jgi:hypothetical protein
VEIAMKLAKPMLLVALAASFAAPAVAQREWPVYGPWLVRLAVRIVHNVVPSQQIIVAGTTVFTPQTEMIITTDCTGAQGIRLLSLICTAVLLLNWRHAANLRFLILYLGAPATLWLYNLARLAFEIVYGEQRYGVSEIMVIAASGVLALAAVRMARQRREHAGVVSSVAGATRG